VFPVSDYAVLALIGVSALALFLSGVALARTYRPPQTADVQRLELQLGEVAQVQADLVERFNKRTKGESMARARGAREQTIAERDALAEKAREILAGQVAAAQQQPAGKAELRRRFGLIR